VLGLVIVVPKLACLEWPRLNPPGGDIPTGLPGDGTGDTVDVLIRDPGVPRSAITLASPSATPLGDTGAGWAVLSDGVVG